ncbi:hypothetical protein JBO41_21210 [Enterobacter asburiae]|uniref:hypothetical protein n=1 Tax=Enterobacter asburiae TaxID=61645 RepID=UPI00192AAF46|nr:hypothetical protein [Enterobacter asburiae]MBL5914654.1 hypothetical protein [Enterobacter asburiae]MBL5919135.1 hypothetical protein [Enterobacter asburiae]
MDRIALGSEWVLLPPGQYQVQGVVAYLCISDERPAQKSGYFIIENRNIFTVTTDGKKVWARGGSSGCLVVGG